MKRYHDKAIILRRVDYGEAARIITFITKNHGVVSALAKGVRRTQSKLAGGLELFSVSDITFLEGRGDLEHVISTRLYRHYGNIVLSYERVSLGYEILKIANKLFEPDKEGEGFTLLETSLEQLDSEKTNLATIELWFYLQLLKIFGHQPNLKTDTTGKALSVDSQYEFDIKSAVFVELEGGQFDANHIKTLRILQAKLPSKVTKVRGMTGSALEFLPTIKRFAENWLH